MRSLACWTGSVLRTPLVIVLTLGVTHAQFASDTNAIFEPVDPTVGLSLVPLSDFQIAGGGPLTLHVRGEILTWLQSQHPATPLQVAVDTGTAIVMEVPTAVDAMAGTVTYDPGGSGATGSAVVVHAAIHNDFTVNGDPAGNAIVTHWDHEAHGGRGGQVVGHADGIERRTYTPGNNGFQVDETIPGQGLGEPLGAEYLWNTTDWNLFSDGSGQWLDAVRPSHERYVAENYSVVAATALVAVRLSDQYRQLHGLPIAHRNAPFAFDPAAPATARVQPGLPVLQLAHLHVVAYENAARGHEHSLATFVLPPFWTPTPAVSYPALFNAQYDVHDTVFHSSGAVVVGTIADLYTLDGHQAVGIVSNGGGSYATLALQASAAPNIGQLFDEAEALLGVDRDEVVVTGGSRGGTAGLALASAPSAPFRPRYVVANSPIPFPVTTLENSINATYNLTQASVARVTGIADAYLDGWMLDGIHDAATVTLFNLFGTTDRALIDGQLSSGARVSQLESQGTSLVLRLATHDHAGSFHTHTRYIAELLGSNVPHYIEIAYRGGHHYSTNTGPTERELLDRVYDGLGLPGPLPLPQEGLFHLRPVTEKPLTTEPFTPIPAPMVLEAPLAGFVGAEHTYTVVGPPETEFQIWAGWVGNQPWSACPTGVPPTTLEPWGGYLLFFSGTLPPALNGEPQTSVVIPFTSTAGTVGPWKLQLFRRYAGETGFTLVDGETSAPALPGDCVAATHDAHPLAELFAGPEDQVGIAIASRTGGLSEDTDF